MRLTTRLTAMLATWAVLGATSPAGSSIAAGGADVPDVWPPRVLAALPAADPPPAGWPVLLMLHGYGVNKDDFDDVAGSLSDHGVAVVAIDGPEDLGGGRRQWGPASDVSRTHEYVRDRLTPLADDARFDWSALHVGGFSQGATHAIFLALTHPETYDGVLAISPAGGNVPESWEPGPGAHRLFLVLGEAEHAGIERSVASAQALWTTAGRDVRIHRHPGGHHFPPDWPAVLGEAVEWLAGIEPTAAGSR